MSAIDSMFRWYKASQKCYVYLSDVSESDPEWSIYFEGSRCFIRGWTQQKLIAPPTVEFFSQNSVFLGDKKSLPRTICVGRFRLFGSRPNAFCPQNLCTNGVCLVQEAQR